MSKQYRIQKYKCMLVKDGSLLSPIKHVTEENHAAEFFMDSLKGLPHEEMHVIFLNGANAIIGFEAVARGSQVGIVLLARDVFRSALARNAAAIIIAHNHPSGVATPSKDDIEWSKNLFRAGAVLGIPVLGSLVCCPETKQWAVIYMGDD